MLEGDDPGQVQAADVSDSQIFLTSSMLQIVATHIRVPTTLPTSEPAEAGRLYTRTVSQLGGSGTQKVLCVSTGPPPPTPSAPDACDAGPTVLISWDDVPDAETYDVQRSVGGGTWQTYKTGLTTTSTTDSEPLVSPSTTYAYRVRACNGNGCSSYSPSTSFTYETLDAC